MDTNSLTSTMISIRLPQDLLDALDRDRGAISRAALIRAALRRALNTPEPAESFLAEKRGS